MPADAEHPTRSPAPSSRPAPPAGGVRVAVLGATGLVGQEMIRLLETRGLPVSSLRPLASSRRGSRTVTFRGEAVPVEEATPEALASVDLVLSSAGGEVSQRMLPDAAAAGAVCVDNTSAFRMDPAVPLVVPEVNGHRLEGYRLGSGRGAIIANPNCSTIQLVVALAPLHEAATIRRAVVSTYQSVSGAGRRAVETFERATQALADGTEGVSEEILGTVAFDVRPEIGGIDDGGDSVEEVKMIRETPKILEAEIPLDVTCVRVPVRRGHAEAVWIETAEPLSPEAARAALARAPGVRLVDGDGVVTPRSVDGEDPVYVGRIRGSRIDDRALQMWVVADNLLKGAALNAVQIAERLVASPAAAGPRASAAAGTSSN